MSYKVQYWRLQDSKVNHSCEIKQQMSQIEKERQISVNGQQLSVTNIQRKTQKVLRIHADDYSTKHLVIFWLLFLAIIILVSCLTLALPPTFIKLNNQVSLAGTPLYNCTNPMGFDFNKTVYCDNVSAGNPSAGLILRNLTPRNQFFFLYLNIILQSKADPVLQFKTDVRLKLFQLDQINSPNGNIFRNKKELQNELLKLQFNSNNAQRLYQDNGYSLKGYRIPYGYQKYIEQQDSLIQISFDNWPILNVRNYYLDAVGVNPQFTIFAIVIRYVFFALSFGCTVGYYTRYKMIPDHLKTLQQRMIMYLSVFTVLFNDPLYAATIMTPNGFTAFTSVTFIVNFITYLIAFWMIFIERIFYQTGQKFDNVINKRKIAYLICLYLSLFILQLQYALIRLTNVPIVSTDVSNKGSIVVFQVISFILFAGGLIYICVQFIRSAFNFFNKIWRNQMFLMFSFIFIIVIIVMLIVNGFSVYEYVGNRILILFTFMNMYTIYLQYMYTVTSSQAQNLDRNRIFGQNSGHEVQTIISNFGNDQIMVDLDSENDSQMHYSSINKVGNKKQQENVQVGRVESRQQNSIEDNTVDHINLPKKQEDKHSKLDSFEMDD